MAQLYFLTQRDTRLNLTTHHVLILHCRRTFVRTELPICEVNSNLVVTIISLGIVKTWILLMSPVSNLKYRAEIVTWSHYIRFGIGMRQLRT
jgi:hypothetical protein